MEEVGVIDSRKYNFAKSYKDLVVYKRAYKISLDIHKLSIEFPKFEQYSLADQLRRSSKSICANLAEGFSRQRQSKPEFKRFVMISISSAEESLVWLDYARDLKYLDINIADKLQQEYHEIIRMLFSLKDNSS